VVVWNAVTVVPIWAAVLALAAGGFARLGAHGPRRPAVLAAATLALITTWVAAACVYQAVHDQQLSEHLAFPGGEESWRLVEPEMMSHRGRVLIALGDGGRMPVAAAIADQLYR